MLAEARRSFLFDRTDGIKTPFHIVTRKLI